VSLQFAVAQFDGEGTAVRRYEAAKERLGEDVAWLHEIGFVEHHHSGHMLMRGTFAGHYLDVDESDHVSQKGAGEGAVAGALIGALLGPPGLALGFMIGGVVGSQVGGSSDVEAEPQELAERLREAVPRSSSAIVLFGSGSDVDEMLASVGDGAQAVTRLTLTPEQTAAIEASLATTPRVPGEQ